MASLDWDCRHTDGVTLVELRVTSDIDERIRIESTIEPVWPPRSQGRPVPGWTEEGYEGTVEGDSPLVLGYASPEKPSGPPAVLTEPAPETETVTARTVAQTLGEAGPPRDAVPVAEAEPAPETDRGVSDQAAATAVSIQDCGPKKGTDDTRPVAWFEAVEERLDRAERLAKVETVQQAREAVEAVGGLDAIRTLEGELDDDRERLEQFERRHRNISERLDRVDIPIGALERLT